MLKSPWFRPALIIILGFAVYGCMLNAPFKFWDDQISIINNPLIRSLHHLKEIFSRGYFNDHTFYRPMVYVSYMKEYLLFGLNSFFFNLDNVLLHILNAFLVWALVRLITKDSAWGFWSGLLFVLHPIHAEAVGNISGRAILLSGSFVLSSFVLFLLYQERLKPGFLLGSVACFILGLLSKESSAVLPAVIFLYLLLNKKPFKALWPFAIVIGFYLIWRRHLGITQMLPYTNLREYLLGFVTFLQSLLTDLRLFVFPANLYFDRSQPMFLSYSGMFLGVLLIWGAIAAVLWTNRKKLSVLVLFALGWFVLEMAPVSQIVTTIGVGPGVISCADHFLYLSSIPVFMLLVQAVRKAGAMNLEKNWCNPRILQMVVGIFFVFLGLMTIEQNIYTNNELAMLQRSLKMQPHNARVQSGIGTIYAFNGKYKEAYPYFVRAVKEDPITPRYQISLAQATCDLGAYEACLDMYNHIQDAGPLEALLNKNKEAARRLAGQHALK